MFDLITGMNWLDFGIDPITDKDSGLLFQFFKLNFSEHLGLFLVLSFVRTIEFISDLLIYKKTNIFS